jgi:PKD repeat protein
VTTRRTAPISLALITVFIVIFLPALRATAASDETDWAQAFEKAKRESPGFAVESVEEFRKLTDHYASLLSDGVTVRSFELPSGDQIRCVEVSSQRSLAASGHPLQPAPGTLPVGDTVTTPKRPGSSIDRPGAEFGLDGTKDAAGNERACPVQTFPKLIPRLENLYHFRRLQDLFQKTPDGGGVPSANPNDRVGRARDALAAAVHEYAHAYRWVNNTGMSADFNLWSPTVEQSSEFSLSQLWVSRGLTADNSLQTAETGWQVLQQLYGDSKPHLFIYYTTGNYQTGTGCYNLSCTGFVQIDSSVPIGGGYTVSSTQGGTQYIISLAYQRNPSPPHDWWLRYNDTWVGYYPNSLFDSEGIANYSDHVDFGGEIVNSQVGGLHTTTNMGSGRFPSEGPGHAAYTKKIQYWDTSGTQFDATGLIRDVTTASYYDLSLGSSADSSVGMYFYFGGPGRVASSAPTASFTYSASPKAGQPVQFTDTSTGSPTSWSWNFGDGGAATTQNPTHTFGTGTYQVSLTVSNSGSSNTNTQALVVSPGSGVGCTADTYTMCLVNGRYMVTSHWKNQYAGGAAANLSKAKLTDTTGAFWIADANTYEYLIRFNTATNNGRTWIAIPTFTDVEFWVDVTDTVGGQSKEYHSAPGNETLIYDPYFFVYP